MQVDKKTYIYQLILSSAVFVSVIIFTKIFSIIEVIKGSKSWKTTMHKPVSHIVANNKTQRRTCNKWSLIKRL